MVTSISVSAPRANRQPLSMMLLVPTFIWLAVFMLVPMVIILVFSLGGRDSLGRVIPGVSPDNYVRFVTGPYVNTLGRSLGLALSTTATCLLIGFPMALWLALIVPPRRQNLFVTLLAAPLWTSFLLRIYAWIVILRPTGFLTHTLTMLGMQNPPVILYTDWAVLLGMVYNYLPFMILPLYAALEKLDKRYLEAARDLGASWWTVLWRVIVPLSARGIVAGVIMVFVPSLGDYVTPDLMGGAKQMYIGSLIQNQFLVVRDWAFGSAVSTFLLVLVTGGVIVYLKYGDQPTVA
jgi:spermidine/putrescine transport system permease protein